MAMEGHPIIARFDRTVDTFFWSLGLGPLNATSERWGAASDRVAQATSCFIFKPFFFNDFLEHLLSVLVWNGFKGNLLSCLILLLRYLPFQDANSGEATAYYPLQLWYQAPADLLQLAGGVENHLKC